MLSLFRLTVVLAAITGKAFAFAPNIPQQARLHNQQRSALSAGLDPSILNSFGSLSIADVADAANAADAAATASGNGFFGFLVEPIEALLELIHNGLNSAGLGANSWGLSIIMLTVIVKGVTFPLNKQQMESTQKMQAMQPQIKAIQAKYESNPEVMNQKVSAFYQESGVNPLAGCLPTLIQFPVLIGLYRSVLNLAKEDKLNEPFLWLPNLEGPIYGADPSETYSWLFSWKNGAPALGWEDTAAFLILPVVLVVAQFFQVELMQPKNVKDRQDNPITKVLPFMIGFFSLGVPSALSVYWVINVFISTASSLYIKNSMPEPVPVASSAPMSSSAAAAQEATYFAPSKLGDRPSGFGTSTSVDEVKPLTSAAIDAEVVTVGTESDDASSNQPISASPVQSKKKGKKRKGKKRKNKN